MKNISYFADFGSSAKTRTGGGQTFARTLFKILDKLPANLTVFAAFQPELDKEFPISSPSVKKINLPANGTLGMPGVGILWSLKLRRLLKKMPRQDLYIFDQPATLFSFFPKAPALVMFHGTDFVKIKISSFLHPRSFIRALFWQKFILNRIQKKFLKRKIGIPLFNSHYTLNILSKDFNLPAKSLEKYVTYLPVEIDKYRKNKEIGMNIRKKLNIPQDAVCVAYISNFAPKKRLDRMPPIISKIINGPFAKNIHFLFVGRSIAISPLDEMFKNSFFKKKCTWIGEVTPEEIHNYYSAADIAISTSESETFGYFIVEGMSASLPFVAYAEGAVPELIEHNKTGFLVNSEDEFVDALLRLIKDKDLRDQFGKNSFLKAKNNFSKEAFKNKFLNILRDDLKIFF